MLALFYAAFIVFATWFENHRGAISRLSDIRMFFGSVFFLSSLLVAQAVNSVLSALTSFLGLQILSLLLMVFRNGRFGLHPGWGEPVAGLCVWVFLTPLCQGFLPLSS